MPERDISSLGVMGLGGWTWPEILPPSPSSPPPPPSGGAAGLAAPLDWLSVTLASYCMPTGRAMEGTGRAMEGTGRAMERTCKSMLGL